MLGTELHENLTIVLSRIVSCEISILKMFSGLLSIAVFSKSCAFLGVSTYTPFVRGSSGQISLER